MAASMRVGSSAELCRCLAAWLRPAAPRLAAAGAAASAAAAGGRAGLGLDGNPARPLLAAEVFDAPSLASEGAAAQRAPPGAVGGPHAGAGRQPLPALRGEARLLQWESARLAREIRGLRVLLRVLRGELPGGEPRTEPLPSATAAVEDSDAESISAASARLREENSRRAAELHELKALVSKLRASSDLLREGGGGDVLVQGRVVCMPGDGSCLFHSLAYGLRAEAVPASRLRREIADFIEASPESVVSGQPMRDWVRWESGLSTDVYADRMRAGGEWGGAIEMAVCSHLRGMNIHVYERVAGGFHRICAFDVKGGGNGLINIAFRPGHYDALELTA